jgi:putative hydrolase of the HAD superfamily
VVHAGYDARPKPHPEPFERALAALDARAERAVHVGNSPSSDVAGARAAGVASAWLASGEDSPEPAPTYRLDSLRELIRPPWRDS